MNNKSILDLRSFTPTLCHLMNLSPPSTAVKDIFPSFLNKGGTIQKALIYCPDAFGLHAFQRFPDLYQRMQKKSTQEIELLSIYPPKTPVCFASLFSGAGTEVHGIQAYHRPVLKCATLFDGLVEAKKKVAIVAVHNSSIDIIFRERSIDYYSLAYDPLVTAKAVELLNQYDVIVVYHQEYDDLLHATGPFSHLAYKALESHVETWEYLVQVVQQQWRENFLLAFTPDHGGHEIPLSTKGDHGNDCPEDMQLRHFYYLQLPVL